MNRSVFPQRAFIGWMASISGVVGWIGAMLRSDARWQGAIVLHSGGSGLRCSR